MAVAVPAVVFLLAVTSLPAQCVMCKSALMNSAEGEALARGLNRGILLLLVTPAVLVLGVAILILVSRLQPLKRDAPGLTWCPRKQSKGSRVRDCQGEPGLTREVIEIMRRNSAEALPVLSKGRLVGVVTQNDLLRIAREALSRDLED